MGSFSRPWGRKCHKNDFHRGLRSTSYYYVSGVSISDFISEVIKSKQIGWSPSKQALTYMFANNHLLWSSFILKYSTQYFNCKTFIPIKFQFLHLYFRKSNIIESSVRKWVTFWHTIKMEKWSTLDIQVPDCGWWRRAKYFWARTFEPQNGINIIQNPTCVREFSSTWQKLTKFLLFARHGAGN